MDGRRPVARRPGTLLAASLLLQETKSPGPGARGCERQPAAGDISAAGVGGAPRREAGRIPEAGGGGGVVLWPTTMIRRSHTQKVTLPQPRRQRQGN